MISRNSLSIPSCQTIGNFLEQWARKIAPIISFAIALVLFIYDAGFAMGQSVHRLNDRLAQIASHRFSTPSESFPPANSEPRLSPSPMTENPTTVSPIGRRSLAILLHSQGYSLSRISQTLGVSKSSARRYILA